MYGPIVTESSADCKGKTGGKDEKIAAEKEVILPILQKIMQNGNFSSKKYDFFGVDRG